MTKRRSTKLSARLLSLGLACVVLSPGCVSELHDDDPVGGTETGNPPIVQPKLDEARVKLVVTTEGVRIEGDKNAATPGASVEIVSALTGEVFHGPVAADGSFGVDVKGSKLDTYAVRVVVDGKKSTNTVYVAPGAAAVETSAEGGSLTCEQRTNLARTQLDALIESKVANDPYATRCRIDTDCTTVSSGSSCNDSCSVYAFSKASASEIEAAKEAIGSGLCKDFSADGCKVLALPCPAPQGEIACAGSVQCALVRRDAGACQNYMVCARGEKQMWPLCQHALGQEPHESLEMVCVADEKGAVALTAMHGDIAITNRGWSHSAYGRFPSTLNAVAESECALQKRSVGDNNPTGALSCWNP